MKWSTTVVFALLAVSGSVIRPASAHPASGIVVDEQGQVFFLYKGICKVEPGGRLQLHSTVGGRALDVLRHAGEFFTRPAQVLRAGLTRWRQTGAHFRRWRVADCCPARRQLVLRER
ncbi:exported hypothetical protein [Verrucomicrobia bacterium]|nr:exported hypothetical protein [Verrucomicrobiota bacterium]